MKMSSHFKDKVIAITGAASGMGLATAKLLASRGASLSLADVQQEALDKAVQAVIECSQPGSRIVGHTVDVRHQNQVDEWIASTVKTLGPLDGAVNLAGVIGTGFGKQPIEGMDEEDWKFVLDVNLTGTMRCLRAEIPAFSARGGGIVNCSSVSGMVGRPNNAAYSVSKHGVIGLTRAAAKEVGKRGIRVNAIAPGLIHTPMIEKGSRVLGVDLADKNPEVAATVLQRFGTAEEIANTIAFLLSHEASFITGAVNVVDGGWIC